jgi:hypothetical protein
MDAVEIAEFLLFASEDDKKALGLFIQGEEDRHINPILSLIKNRIDMGRFYVSALSSIYPPAVYQALFEDILVHFGFRHYLKFDTEFLPDNTSFSNLLAVAKKELNSKNIWPALEILAKALTINPNCAEAKEMQTQIREDLLKTLENRGDSGRFGYAKLFELAKRFKVESEIKYWSHLLINSQA